MLMIQSRTGYKVIVVTLKRLQLQTDAFKFADKVIESWYPTAALGDKKAVFVLVKGTKEGAILPFMSSRSDIGPDTDGLIYM